MVAMIIKFSHSLHVKFRVFKQATTVFYKPHTNYPYSSSHADRC